MIDKDEEIKKLKEKISKAIEVAKTALSAQEMLPYNDPFNEEQLYFATLQLSKTLRILEGSE
jgi:hypothetical protein|tara:strand:- start:1198 stop:1383 length:186 start_codon:yes stop_codon:yes gene_type:complete